MICIAWNDGPVKGCYKTASQILKSKMHGDVPVCNNCLVLAQQGNESWRRDDGGCAHLESKKIIEMALNADL